MSGPTPLLLGLLLCLALAAGADPEPRGHDGAPMVRVDGGPFVMGADDGEPDEAPRRTVHLPAFWIDVHEVTNAQYRRFCEATGHKGPIHWKGGTFQAGREEWPVVNVTWSDAVTYARWAGKRLPTEAEWEKAARGTDGRAYPWGGEADPKRAALDDEELLGPVGRYPAGASPCGCLDMAGNAWEWTASWYNAYPGSGARPTTSVGPVVYSPLSIHYGRKYKVIRGGGAIAYYGVPDTGRCADRARALPFGAYDGLGFRCAMDDGDTRPTVDDSAEALVPAPPSVRSRQLKLGSPVVLTVAEPAGVSHADEEVTSGVPFPEGALRSGENVRLLDEKGGEVPLAARVTGTWRDGSIQWLLLRFPCAVKARGTRWLRLEWGPHVARTRRLDLPPEGPRQPAALSPILQSGQPSLPIGELRPIGTPQDAAGAATVIYGDAGGRPRFRVSLVPDAPDVQGRAVYAATITQVSDDPIVPLADWSCPIGLEWAAKSCVFGGDARAHRFALRPGDRLELVQQSDLHYEVRRNGRVVTSGTRAPGWVTVYDGLCSRTFAIRDFWQQYPMALVVEPYRVTLRFWVAPPRPMTMVGSAILADTEPETPPFDFDRGMAKTVTFMVRDGEKGDTGEAAARAFQHPLFAAAPPAWYCGTKALGELAPYDLDRFPAYETAVETASDLWMRNRPYGFRHWGDTYMGGPYKGKNAYNNLEYDVPYDLLMQFARTGSRKYLDAAMAAASHQADIDTNHLTGQPWKHSPRHTETPTELGHVFVRGLIEYTHFTGDPRGLETARQVGDWLCGAINNRAETGNERQIGWGLYALTGIYAATWDRKYLDATKPFVDRLVAEQEPTGKFNIRWDNRISFFNGLAMAGLRRYYEATGDEKVAAAILRMIDRTLGFYPEYAGRTLDGLAWAYDRTGDRRYLTLLARTWETTKEYLTSRRWGPDSTLFTTRYLPFLAAHGLAPRPERPLGLGPAKLDTYDGRYLTRIEAPSATLLLRDATGRAFDLVVFRQAGVSPASVRLREGDRTVGTLDLTATADNVTRHVLPVPAGPGPRVLELALRSEQPSAWDVVTSRAIPRVVRTDAYAGIDHLTPRIYFRVTGPRVAARFEALGEGFHGAVLYDPAGHPVAAVSKFVDLGDAKAYRYVLEAAIPRSQIGKVWSMDIQEGRLLEIAGAEDSFATTRAAWFDMRVAAGHARRK